MADLSDFIQGIEQLIELAQKLDEKKNTGGLRTEVRIQARSLGSSIPPSGSIPRRRSAQTGDPSWSSEPQVMSTSGWREPPKADPTPEATVADPPPAAQTPGRDRASRMWGG